MARVPVTALRNGVRDSRRPIGYIGGPGDHRRFEIMLLPGEDPQAIQQPDTVLSLLSRWLAPGDAEVWRAASAAGQYGGERGRHLQTLTIRIKAIGRQICERDPDAARARDAALLAQGGGRPPGVVRQEVVPPLETGFLAGTGKAAEGTLFPQPFLRSGEGWARMDRVTGDRWRVFLAPGASATAWPRADRPLRIGPARQRRAACRARRRRRGLVRAPRRGGGHRLPGPLRL